MTIFGWIFIGVVIGISSIILIFMFVDIVCVLTFKRIFKKHHEALAVVLNVKYEYTVKLYDFIKANEVEISGKVIKMFENIASTDFNDPESLKCRESMKNLTYIRSEFLFAARNNEILNKDIEFALFKESFKQVDTQYSNSASLYNADVIGYNYWIDFWPTRFIWKLMKFTKKEVMSL